MGTFDNDDDFARGYSDIPDDDKLRTMTYIAPCGLLASSESGSQKYFVVEAEKRRRDALKEAPTQWFHKPLGIIWLAIIGGVLTVLVVFLLKTYFALSL